MARAPDTIRVINGLHKDAYTYYPILIVGAGESAIALASRLREEGFDQFRLFERQSGIGGTWWINRYPGVACDMYVGFQCRLYRWISLTFRPMQTSRILLIFLLTQLQMDQPASRRPGDLPISQRYL